MLDYFEDDLQLVLAKTGGIWTELKNKTIFITGGTGFFGIWLQMSFIHINRRLGLNSNLIILTRSKSSFLNSYPWIEQYSEIGFIEGDITNFEYFEGDVDYIVHAATEASVKLNLEQPLAMFDTIVLGTKHILEFARLKNVKSFLMTSSGAVYGKQPSEIENISEDYIGAPVSNDPAAVYGEGKRMAEVLSSVYFKHFDLPVKIARCYAFIGPFLPLDSHFAAGNFIKNILVGDDIVIEGDGTPFRSYMYSADLMVWLWTILFKGENNRHYNVGSDISVSIATLANMVAETNEEQQVNIIIKTPISNNKPLRYVPNVNRARNELDLALYTDLKTSIKKTLQFNKGAKI